MGAGRRGHQIIAWHSAPLALRLVPSAFRLSPFAWHPSPLALSTALSARLASHRPVLTPGGAAAVAAARAGSATAPRDRKSTRLNSSHVAISYAVFCLKKKKKNNKNY